MRKNDPRAFGEIQVLLRDGPLNLDRARDGVDDARELDQRPVAHELDDAAVMPVDRRLDEIVTKRLEPGERARLVHAHQAAVSHHVGGEDGNQLPVHVLSLFHRA